MNSLRKNKYISTKNSLFHINLPADEYEERGVDVPEEEEVLQPDLFSGEVVIAAANNVLKFSPGSEHNTGISGTLYITNLRVTLHTMLPPTPQEAYLHHHSLNHIFLGPHDIELSLVAALYQLDEHNNRRKALSLEMVLPDRVAGIQLVLKNFRVVNLSFKFSPVGEEAKVMRALLHHISPASVDLLFLTPGRPPPAAHIPSYRLIYDWQCELERTRCPGWRVTQHNERFNLCATYPPALVVPYSLLDTDIERAAHHFSESRALAWLWGAPGGAALLSMAHISPNMSDTEMENALVRAVHRSHPSPEGQVIKILDLDKELPQPMELLQAVSRLRQLHLPDGSSGGGSSYLSRFESSRWLGYVSSTLAVARKAAHDMADRNLSVILQEGSGRDTACVVGTLIEVLCDPFARTLRGLHSALAKHWVALGHPFTTRLGLTRQDRHLQGPMFLLLLDCLHQVCVQQPHLLEYSPQYLAALWGAAHSPLYSTCLFDSANARHSTITVLQRESRTNVAELWDLWNWWASCAPQTPTAQNTPLTTPDTTPTATLNNRRNGSIPTSLSNDTEEERGGGGGGGGGAIIGLRSGSATEVIDDSVDGQSCSSYSLTQQQPREGADSGRKAADNSVRGKKRSQTTHSPVPPVLRECTESCKVARRSFLSPLYVHQLFLSLLPPGAVDRIKDPLSIAHHTWHQIRRLLFPATTQHLPYDTNSSPPIFPQLAHEPRPPSKSHLSAPLLIDPSIPRLEPWVGLFGQWLPEQGHFTLTGSVSDSRRKLILPQNPHLLFWDIIYEMYDTVSNYLNQPSVSKMTAIIENLENGLKI